MNNDKYFDEKINSCAIEFSKNFEKAIQNKDQSILDRHNISDTSSMREIIEASFRQGCFVTTSLLNTMSIANQMIDNHKNKV